MSLSRTAPIRLIRPRYAYGPSIIFFDLKKKRKNADTGCSLPMIQGKTSSPVPNLASVLLSLSLSSPDRGDAHERAASATCLDLPHRRCLDLPRRRCILALAAWNQLAALLTRQAAASTESVFSVAAVSRHPPASK